MIDHEYPAVARPATTAADARKANREGTPRLGARDGEAGSDRHARETERAPAQPAARHE